MQNDVTVEQVTEIPERLTAFQSCVLIAIYSLTIGAKPSLIHTDIAVPHFALEMLTGSSIRSYHRKAILQLVKLGWLHQEKRQGVYFYWMTAGGESTVSDWYVKAAKSCIARVPDSQMKLFTEAAKNE